MPSAYEQNAAREIATWRSAPPGRLTRLVRWASRPLDRLGQEALKLPGIGWVVRKSVGGLVDLLNDASQLTVRVDAVYEAYRKQGHEIASRDDLFRLDLADVDRAIGFLAAKYKGLAAAEGGATGWFGGPALIADIPALIGLNLRAIGEYATYCGFDVRSQQERRYALEVLLLASATTDAAKQLALAELGTIARQAARKKSWQELEKRAFARLVRDLGERIGIRVTKAKLAQITPVAGALVGTGFNAYFTSRVCDAAYHLYRERFLAEKYGTSREALAE